MALIRGRRLFKRLIPQRQNILIVQFNLLHEHFLWLTGLKLTLALAASWILFCSFSTRSNNASLDANMSWLLLKVRKIYLIKILEDEVQLRCGPPHVRRLIVAGVYCSKYGPGNTVPYFWPKPMVTIPFGASHTYIAHVREYPPPRLFACSRFLRNCKLTARNWENYCLFNLLFSRSILKLLLHSTTLIEYLLAFVELPTVHFRRSLPFTLVNSKSVLSSFSSFAP